MSGGPSVCCIAIHEIAGSWCDSEVVGIGLSWNCQMGERGHQSEGKPAWWKTIRMKIMREENETGRAGELCHYQDPQRCDPLSDIFSRPGGERIMAKCCTKPLPQQDPFMKDGSQRWVWNGIISRAVINTNAAFGLRLSLTPQSWIQQVPDAH